VSSEGASDLTIRDHEGGGEAWDRFVASAPGSTFCHLWGWREVMEGVLGHRPRYRVALDSEGRTVGVLPMVEVRSRLFGSYLLSMPFLNDGGPLGADPVRVGLAEDAIRAASEARVDLLELRVREPLSADAMPDAMQVSERKVTVLLDLPEEAGTLWDALGGKVRSQVRRPTKEGMTCQFGPEEAEPFYRVFTQNMRDLGTPVLPFALFDALRETFPNEVVFATVRMDGEPVAGGCGFLYLDECEITWASSLRAFNRMAPNMLLYWSFLEEVIRRGGKVFNFGRCTPDGGTHRFKLQWGGRTVPLPWAQWSPGGVSATPSPDRPLFRMATSVWSRLPVAVTNRVGPFLARQLP
jgi:FemAB-related protein (PEP-CTERM system-associated)